MNECKSKWSVVVTNTHYVKTPEKDELCCSNQNLISAYDHLHSQWIGADEFIRHFSLLFTDSVRCNDNPAVTIVLQRGLMAYAATLPKVDRHYHYLPHERLKNFLAGCFRSAKILCRFVVIDKKKGEKWSLLHEMPFSIWRFNRTDLDIRELDMAPDDFAALLYSRVVPENMKLAMRRFDHEAAIMAGDLGGCH